MSNKARKKRMLRGRSEAKPITLRQYIGSGVEVDREAGLIRNVAIISEGPALGHGFSVDTVMCQQVHAHLSNNERTRVRLTHPGEDFFSPRDPIEVLVGRVENPRIEGSQVRGDVRIGSYAAHSPSGNLREYLLAVAAEDPQAIGMSIVFEPAAFEQSRGENGEQIALGRVARLLAVDFVGDPGANRNGLLSKGGAPPAIGVKRMDEQLLNDLRVVLGLPEDATEEDVSAVARARAIEAGAEPEPDDTEPADEAAPPAPPPPTEGMSAGTDEQAIRLAERNRQKQIRQLAKSLSLGDAWAQKGIDADLTLSQAKEAALEAVKINMKKANVRGTGVEVGEDRNLSTLSEGIRDAILLRSGAITEDKAHPRSREFRRPLVEMARRYLSVVGVPDAEMLTGTQIVERLGPRAMRRHYPTVQLAQGTSDFDNILADASNKVLRQAYMDEPVKWNRFCRRDTNPDFKSKKFMSMSESPDLVARDEGAGLTYVTLSDGKEQVALVEYVGGIKITRQAIINDDLNAFGRIPMLQGAAAKRKEDDLAFGILTANAALADNVALFYSTHANLISSGSGAPSVATIAALEKLIRKQKGPKSAARLNLEPKILLVPTSLRVTALQLVGSRVDPAKSNDTPNPYANMLEVIDDSRLDDNSTTAWYLSVDPNRFDTIVLVFLDGEPAPVLRQETDFDTEDVKFAVRHVVAAKAVDYRGLAKTVGTA